MNSVFWSGFFGVLLGGLFTLVGGERATRAARKQLRDQLANADRVRFEESRLEAYVELLVAAESVEVTLDTPHSVRRHDALVNFGRAMQRVKLVAPAESLPQLNAYYRMLLESNRPPTEDDLARISEARHHFVLAARMDAGTDARVAVAVD